MTGASGMARLKRVLITGTTGFLGHRLFEYLKFLTNWEVIGTSRSVGKYVDYIVDLTDLDGVKDLKISTIADVVIHTAAISKTDVCENNKEECYASNVIATKNLVSTYNTSKIVFFSTYAVYNTPEGPCEESAPVSATNYYIKTKLLSETVVKTSPHPIIFRPSVIFGFTPFERISKNYFMQLRENIKNRKVTRSPIDQYFNPIHVDVVGEITKNAIERDISGIYNLGSNEEICKYEFNKKIMQRFHFNQRYLEGINSSSLAVSRPNNGTISSRLIQDTLAYRIPNLDQMIEVLYQSTLEYPIAGGK
jgi:dTDP-4-dehydrorhamnose reductase